MAIVAMATFPGSVKLHFDKSLRDPKGLLEGAGTKVRSVTIKAVSELDHGDIHRDAAQAGKATAGCRGSRGGRCGAAPDVLQALLANGPCATSPSRRRR